MLLINFDSGEVVVQCDHIDVLLFVLAQFRTLDIVAFAEPEVGVFEHILRLVSRWWLHSHYLDLDVHFRVKVLLRLHNHIVYLVLGYL